MAPLWGHFTFRLQIARKKARPITANERRLRGNNKAIGEVISLHAVKAAYSAH